MGYAGVLAFNSLCYAWVHSAVGSSAVGFSGDGRPMERENGRGSRDATRDHRPAGPGAHLHSVAPTPTSLKGASGCCLLWAGRRQFGSNGSHPRPENPSSELGGVVISPPRSGQNPPWNGRGMAMEWPWNGWRRFPECFSTWEDSCGSTNTKESLVWVFVN